jgi:undecaprenyl-diphosphatase
MKYPLLTSLGIGVFQCLAMVPGVSRSGATIVGALMLRGDKRSAAEFSFFLAIPTMVGAFAYDLYKNRDAIDASQAGLIGIGFVTAFISGLVVIKVMLDFVAKRGFAPFAWWRIAVGAVGLALIYIPH